jgi:hypothetical protein
VFCRRINAEISFGYVRLSGRMKKLRYVWNITGFRTAKKPVLHEHKLGRTDWPCLLNV